MPDKQLLETMFKQHSFNDFKWIKAEIIKIAQWVRFKCLFGCPGYAKTATCPPHVPSIAACREFIADYNNAVIFHFEKNVLRPEDRKPWSKEMGERLYKLEREVFWPVITRLLCSTLTLATFAPTVPANVLPAVNYSRPVPVPKHWGWMSLLPSEAPVIIRL